MTAASTAELLDYDDVVARFDPVLGLEDNDSNRVLGASGDLLVTGPTNTNLLDLYLVLVGAPSS